LKEKYQSTQILSGCIWTKIHAGLVHA